jgi:carotene biosynthesis associated membrane protein
MSDTAGSVREALLTPPVERRPSGWGAPVVLGALTVLLQIVYPLVHGEARDQLTVVTVIVFFLASVSHALAWRGPRFTAALVGVTAGGGFLVEVAGVQLGLPFGAYAYTGQLGAEVLGVPLIIPLAWTMMAYPALLVGRRITRHRLVEPLVAGTALASWDLFLDPQMVDAGHWVWLGGGPAVLDIPVSNFAGWLVTAVVMMALLRPALDRTSAPAVDDRVPLLLYLWVYASSVLAHLAFFGLPASALLGGVGMGAVVLAFLLALRRSSAGAR